MISLQSYVRQGRQTLRRWAVDPRVHGGLRAALHFLAGFCFSAASLAHGILPLSMALTCACTGWSAVLVAGGGALGYLLFWGTAGQQAVVWLVCSLLITLVLADRRICRSAPLLLPATAGLIVAICGVIFQSLERESAAIVLYLIRVGLAMVCTWLFTLVLQGRNPILDWLACGFAVLSLAQIVPIPYLGLGYIAAGALTSAASFPAAAIAGLALDLAQVTPVPMTAVMALGYLIRFLPRHRPWLSRLSPGVVYIGIMCLCGHLDLQPVAGLFLGGILGSFLPLPGRATHRRGETGVAQVRLELAAGVLTQTQQLLVEVKEPPVDESALVARAAERACGNCPYRKSCKDSRRISQLPGPVLHKSLLSAEELPIVCRKSGRFLAELHRSQEQLRSIQADRERQREYRAALVQQYRFLSEFLRDLSDQLSRKITGGEAIYEPRVTFYGNRPEGENGDRCLRFMGTGCSYYVLLCDGMGTGLGAVQEGRTAATLLRKMLTAGYPAEYALRSVNSLCALRERAGAVTIDLARLQLDSGKVTIYKWGAAPSYLVSGLGAEKIGAASPPPGLSVTDSRELSDRFTLRRDHTLVMVSDGISEDEALRCCLDGRNEPPGELASRLLSCSQREGGDDATVVLIRLLACEEESRSKKESFEGSAT